MAVIPGQPAKLLVDMKPEARKFIRLLKFDPNHGKPYGAGGPMAVAAAYLSAAIGDRWQSSVTTLKRSSVTRLKPDHHASGTPLDAGDPGDTARFS